MKFRTRVHYWSNGRLRFSDYYFDNEENAMGFANKAIGHHIKVYDPDGELLQHVQHRDIDNNTYA